MSVTTVEYPYTHPSGEYHFQCLENIRPTPGEYQSNLQCISFYREEHQYPTWKGIGPHPEKRVLTSSEYHSQSLENIRPTPG